MLVSYLRNCTGMDRVCTLYNAPHNFGYTLVHHPMIWMRRDQVQDPIIFSKLNCCPLYQTYS